jgi:diguanylate cyclase (GGDEF)-like protein
LAGTAINRWGEFSAPEDEKRYQEDNWQSTLRRVRFLVTLSAVGYACGVVVDSFDNGGSITGEFWVMASLRVLVLLAGLATRAFAARKTTPYDFSYILAAYTLLIGLSETVSIFVDRSIGLPETGVPFIVAMILFYYLFLPPRLLPAIIGGWAGAVIYVAALVVAGTAGASQIATVAIFLVLANLFGHYFFVSFARAQRNEYRALAEERAVNRQLQAEIAERKKAEERLTELATVDELTNVANRRHFIETLVREMNRAKRSGVACCILMIDIDHFKAINDNFGHDMGDAALKKLVEICRRNLRAIDMIGRLGGEEFGVLLPETVLEQGVAVGRRICRAVAADPTATGDGPLRITVSIGVAAYTATDTDIDVLLKKADIALYEAKKKGRNRVCAMGETE